MKPKLNYKKLLEAVEGFPNRTIISLKDAFSSLSKAEDKAYSEAENIKNGLYLFLNSRSLSKINLDEIIHLNDFGKIDVDKSRFHGVMELSNAEIGLLSYAEPTISGIYNGKICFMYHNAEFNQYIPKKIEKYIKDISNKENIKNVNE